MNKIISSVFIVTAIMLLCGCTQRPLPKDECTPDKVTVGAGKSAVLVYIASEKDFFKKNCLDVTVIDFQAGKLATDALLSGKVDVSTASESVFVSKAFEQTDLRTFAVISSYRTKELLALKEHGILNVGDLRGKRIGVTGQSDAEFALGVFLIYNGIMLDEVEIVDLRPTELSDALANGEIDAAMAWEPHSHNMKSALGDKVVSWDGASGQSSHFLLITKKQWLEAHPKTVTRMLMALIDAEEYSKTNKYETQKILEKQFKLDSSYIQSVWWPKYTLEVTLPQILVLGMEDRARWRIENNLTEAREVPNYLEFVYAHALLEVKPESVTIIL